jgi:cell division protein FtsW
MALFLSRTDRSRLSRWWWTVDHWSLGALALLMAAGALMMLAASPAVAQRIGLEPFHFVSRQVMFMVPAAALVVFVSALEPREIVKAAAGLFVLAWLGMVATLAFGEETKGATRWLHFGPIGAQPSEFVKPAFVVCAAWALTARREGGSLSGLALASVLFAMVACVLLLQPDFGQTMLVASAFAALLFIWGVPWPVIGALGGLASGGAYAAYTLLPHVTQRVDSFLDPKSGGRFQVDTALAAIGAGGPGGAGPGQGQLKFTLPDAHADFIFAVAGEEFGLIAGLLIIGLFATVFLRGMLRAQAERDPFAQLAAAGLLVIFCLQAVINMAVNLDIAPAKGMTLPFISYGGSSMLALAVTAGMFLALTRRRPGQGVRR